MHRRPALRILANLVIAYTGREVIKYFGSEQATNKAAENGELLPHFPIEFLVLDIPPPLAGNVSFIQASIPFPEIADGEYVSIGGRPIGALILGSSYRWPDDTPAIYGLAANPNQNISLQAPFCGTEPYNDWAKKILIPRWAAEKPGFSLTLWEHDTPGGSGQNLTINSAYLTEHAVPVEMLALNLAGTPLDSQTSLIQARLTDVWTELLQNIGGLYLGDNYPLITGRAIINARKSILNLQEPCPAAGNDLRLGYLLFPTSQLRAGPDQFVRLVQNDTEDPGGQLFIKLCEYAGDCPPPAAAYTSYLPLILKSQH